MKEGKQLTILFGTIILSLLFHNVVIGFTIIMEPSSLLSHGSSSNRCVTTTTTIFLAKKGGKTKKRKQQLASKGGGFGSGPATTTTTTASSSTTKPTNDKKTDTTAATAAASNNNKNKDDDDDYAIFPPLEPQVANTLVPATYNNDMSSEIYQRLKQIYGFPDFNFEQEQGDEEETVPSSSSIEDILSQQQPETDSTISTKPVDNIFLTGSSSPSSTAADLDSLLAAATGGKAKTSITSPSSSPTQKAIIANDGQTKKPNVNDLRTHLNKLPEFENINVLHIDPLVLSIDNFFTDEECDKYIELSNNKALQSRSPTVGKDAAAKAQRTSTTFYHKYKDVPELICKATRLLGLRTIEKWEEPQTVRYRKNEKFTWHLDALGPMETDYNNNSGQRLATLLVYLSDLSNDDGGATIFRDLGNNNNKNKVADDENKYLRVQPKKGMGLLFFPAAGGIPNTPFDIRTLHCGEIVKSNSTNNDKWIAQLWLRQRKYIPTAPPGNIHMDAMNAIINYCNTYK